MRSRTPTFLLAFLVLAACGTTSLLVNAEKDLTVAFDTTQAVIQADYDGAAPCRTAGVPVTAACSQLEAAVAGAHKVANDLRTLFPPVLQAANGAVGVYRAAAAALAAVQASKTATADELATATANEQAALAAMNTALANVAVYVAEAQGVWSKWNGGK